MLQVIPKWQVVVTFNHADAEPVNFSISDNHWQNVVRTLATMDFPFEVLTVEVAKEVQRYQQTGVTTSVSQEPK